MNRLLFYVRSFHPLSNFGLAGLGYHGDNRGFSFQVDEKTTSRIYAIAEINLAAANIRRVAIKSDPSSSLGNLIEQDYSTPETQPRFTTFSGMIDPYREDGDQGGQLLLAYTGQNFAMPLADNDTVRDNLWEAVVPGLDVTAALNIEVDRDAERMSFALRMVGDGFPNAEAFLIDPADEALMLVTHRRIGSALHQLRGNRRIAMASSGGEVDFPNDQLGTELEIHWCIDYAEITGAAIDVQAETEMTPSTREEWNEMHTGRSNDGRLLGDTIPTYAPGRPGSSMP